MHVVTGWHPEGYQQYGKQFVSSFERWWPHSVGLSIYTEEPIPTDRGVCVNRWEPNGVKEFIDRNKDIPERNGRAPVPGWSVKHFKRNYNFRFDAVKFCWQLFYPEHAAESLPDGTVMIWLDGDVITTDYASLSGIGHALDGYDLCHLGRITTQSELGFWAVRLNDETRSFLKDVADTYRTDRVFTLSEWHSGYVFDDCLKRFGGRANNLTPGGTGNVWCKSPLATFSTHLKGRAKEGYI